MRALLPAILSIGIAVRAAGAEPPPRREIENVAAFARIYGALRYFYPSDAAASLDWNRFAVLGVSASRGAR